MISDNDERFSNVLEIVFITFVVLGQCQVHLLLNTDIVNHQENGWLARPFDTGDLAKGIGWVLGDEIRRAVLGATARATVEERFSATLVAKKYGALYADVMQGIAQFREA